jgi:hypothetical protein
MLVKFTLLALAVLRRFEKNAISPKYSFFYPTFSTPPIAYKLLIDDDVGLLVKQVHLTVLYDVKVLFLERLLSLAEYVLLREEYLLFQDECQLDQELIVCEDITKHVTLAQHVPIHFEQQGLLQLIRQVRNQVLECHVPIAVPDELQVLLDPALQLIWDVGLLHVVVHIRKSVSVLAFLQIDLL